jgi:hypothetical protein
MHKEQRMTRTLLLGAALAFGLATAANAGIAPAPVGIIGPATLAGPVGGARNDEVSQSFHANVNAIGARPRRLAAFHSPFRQSAKLRY